MIALTHCKDKTLYVLGLARSGRAVVAAALAGGARVLAWDDGAEARDRVAAEFPQAAITAPDDADWTGVALLVPAPGVPLTHPEPHPAVRAARTANVPVAGDVELFAREFPMARIVGITGTNGKSTTTALLGHILADAGQDTVVAGNIGRPILELDPPTADRVHVIELSSYQLDLCERLRPQVAILLNITPDHLDRHGDMAGYVRAKHRLFRNMGPGTTAVIGIDDRYGRDLVDMLSHPDGPKVVPFAIGRPRPGAVYALNDQLFADGIVIMGLTDLPALPGEHNQQNIAAACGAAMALGVSARFLARGVRSFPGLPHRIERVGIQDGIRFYNDSKATNAEAAARALSAFRNIYWIAGGKPKEGDLSALYPLLDRVRHTYLIGMAEARFAVELSGRTDCVPSGTLQRAIEQAWADARAERAADAADSDSDADIEDSIILLSPACASFDQFTSFEARGDAFRTIVQQMLQGGDG